MIATVIAHPVATIVVPIISVGLREPACIRTAITVAGISVIQEVFKARKVIIAGLATSGVEFSFWSSCIAFSPKGVAALPKPKILALKFIIIAPSAGLLGLRDGNKRRTAGPKTRARPFMKPASSAKRMSPNHKLI